MMDFIKKLVENREFIPVVDRSYCLASMTETYHYTELVRRKGNVVIKIRDESLE